MTIKSLKARHNNLADPEAQLDILGDTEATGLPTFKQKLLENQHFPFTPSALDVLQINVGYMCNQTCKHCHVDAGPDRKEIMTRDTMQQILDAVEKSGVKTVDLTGGAPEMNPDFRWFVQEIRKRGAHVMVRCNLTIIVANKKYHDLPQFFKEHEVEVISSLPYFSASRTDAQRGDGVFDRSIKALKMLNEVGYGKEETGLKLNLVYNPTGAFLPPSQASLEREFKEKLARKFDVEFNHLFCITNMPISRYLEYLMVSGNYQGYMEKLVNSFNPSALGAVMCRNTLSIGWDGYLYDCDFNQMLELKVDGPQHISEFDATALAKRKIAVNQHCFGCTAGAGSSCGGEVV